MTVNLCLDCAKKDGCDWYAKHGSTTVCEKHKPLVVDESTTPLKAGGESIIQGDCIEVMRGMEAGSIHAIVTDPPYGLEFMGEEWDKFKVVTHEKMGGFTEKDKQNWSEPFKTGLPRFSNQAR